MTYVVTNAHVAVHGRALKLNTRSGNSEVVPVTAEQWVEHRRGDDLAVAALLPSNAEFRYKALDASHFLTKEKMATFSVGIGDEVFFMGRFIAHDGKQTNQPIARFGSIAMMPGEPVLQKGRDYMQESYLVDARSMSGFSGSPVMLYIPPFSLRFPTGKFSPEQLTGQAAILLLGVDWGSMVFPDGKQTNTNIMGVVPVGKLEELLQDPAVIEMSHEVLREALARLTKQDGGVVDFAGPSERDNFNALAEEIVEGSRSEADSD
jgi:hypothetical protein